MNPFPPETQPAPEDDTQPFVMPEGFSSRIMQRLDLRQTLRQTERQTQRRARTRRLVVATALLIGLGAGGVTAIRRHEERQQAQQARAQFVLAMQVTTKSLSATERALAKIGKTHLANNRSTPGEL